MPRPIKKRHICCMPAHNRFGPKGVETAAHIELRVDEYETLRLIDLEGGTQEECAAQMNIARTTVQGIYINARRKVADALVNGKDLIIEGGDYVLCPRYGKQCVRGCEKHCRRLFEDAEDE